MMARWNRPPEIILNLREFDSWVDEGSLGCIFVEIIYHRNDQMNDPDDRILFRGSSCYPLSPDTLLAGKDSTKSDAIKLVKVINSVTF